MVLAIETRFAADLVVVERFASFSDCPLRRTG
jgi:hypothetical protein